MERLSGTEAFASVLMKASEELGLQTWTSSYSIYASCPSLKFQSHQRPKTIGLVCQNKTVFVFEVLASHNYLSPVLNSL